MTDSERISPHYCPYCGDEDLRPHVEPHGLEPNAGAVESRAAWECRSCTRVFTVKFVGLVV